MQSEVSLWFGGSLFVLLGVGSTWLVRGYWSGKYTEKVRNALSPLGNRMGRSIESTIPLDCFGTLYMGLMIFVLLIVGPRTDEPATPLSTVFTVILLGLIAVLFLVLLFNRPHVLIPPHLRKGHAGLLGNLLTKRPEQ